MTFADSSLNMLTACAGVFPHTSAQSYTINKYIARPLQTEERGGQYRSPQEHKPRTHASLGVAAESSTASCASLVLISAARVSISTVRTVCMNKKAHMT